MCVYGTEKNIQRGGGREYGGTVIMLIARFQVLITVYRDGYHAAWHEIVHLAADYTWLTRW